MRENALRDAALHCTWKKMPPRAASRQWNVVTSTEHISWLQRVLSDPIVC
jgi:hypothetical protein